MLDPLFTPEDVADCRSSYINAVWAARIFQASGDEENRHVQQEVARRMKLLADRIQQYLDQQARTITIPLDRAIQAGSSVVSMTWSDGTPVSSEVAERILAGLSIPEGVK